jgi:hypothetical protein
MVEEPWLQKDRGNKYGNNTDATARTTAMGGKSNYELPRYVFCLSDVKPAWDGTRRGRRKEAEVQAAQLC